MNTSDESYVAAEMAAALAPVKNRSEASWVAHMLTEMNIIRPAVDAAIQALPVCPSCGVIVADRELHERFHNEFLP